MITKSIIQKFDSLITSEFYFLDAKTANHVAMATKKYNYRVKQFNKAQHLTLIQYVVTIGGDGTILYAAK